MTTQSLSPLFDDSRVNALSQQLTNIFNSSALSLMVSIGHRTRLFEVLSLLPPSKSEQVAHAAGLQERYVQEWLNVMVVGKILDYSSSDQTYYLPPEHAILLTRATSPINMTSIAQYVPVITSDEDQIVRCFSEGSSVGNTELHRFHEMVAEDNAQRVVSALEDHILPLVPELLEELKLGIDVLELGCSRGHILNKFALLFPNSQFTGYDLNETEIETATHRAQSQQLHNVHYQVRDIARLEEVEKYNLITTFDAMQEHTAPNKLLRNIYNALRPDGVYFRQEIHAASDVSGNLNHPLAPLLYTVSCVNRMTTSSAIDDFKLVIGREKALQSLQDAGFTHIEIKQLPHDVVNDYYVVHK